MESLIYPGSVPSFRSQLDLTSIPMTNISILQSEFHTYYPYANIKDSSNPVEFIIPSSTSYFLDLNSSFLYLRLRILKSNDTNLSATDIVAPSHGFLSAMFNSLEVSMNSTIISKIASLYSYRAHILDLLTHGTGYKATILSTSMYYPDLKSDTFTAAENKGFETRLNYSKLSTPFEVLGKLSETAFTQDRYFPSEIETKIVLRRSPEAFCLTGADIGNATQFPYKLVIDDCVLYVKKYLINSQVLAYHQKLLSSGKKYQYPLRTIEMRTFSIAQGCQSIASEVLFRNYLPEYLVITFVDSVAINASIKHSAFNFQPFGISSIKAYVDGDSSVYRSLSFDTANNISLLEYNTLLTAQPYTSDGHGISRSDYIDGSFLIVLDIQSSNMGNRFQAKKRGHTSIDLTFKSPLTKSINCIVLGQFSELLTIDENRVVSMMESN